MNEALDMSGSIVAMKLVDTLDAAGFPFADSWNLAEAIRFASDWQGKNRDAGRETEVRVLWTEDTLYLQFRCRYRALTVFENSEPNGRRDQLWDRDVAEVFIQTDPAQLRRYWEFEVSPNGLWIDLAISPEGKRDPKSGMKSRVVLDESKKLWVADVALPMHALTEVFDPSEVWRVNFFRVEGPTEPRFYSAWRPTNTRVPNFHVPEAFGDLRFQSNAN
jgi:alpha-galactosidase